MSFILPNRSILSLKLNKLCQQTLILTFKEFIQMYVKRIRGEGLSDEIRMENMQEQHCT